jgi:hypothetical protein
MALLHSSMAWGRLWRFAVICAAWSAPCLLSGCVTYHAAGQPYSGTAWWLRNAARPWCCYDDAPNKPLAFAIGVPYTSIVAFFAAASVLGETLILPTDYFYGVPDFPLPSEPSCEKFWGKPKPPGPEEPQLSPVLPAP